MLPQITDTMGKTSKKVAAQEQPIESPREPMETPTDSPAALQLTQVDNLVAMKDFKVTTAKGFIDSMSDSKNSKLIVTNNNEIPCKQKLCKANGKPNVIKLTVVRVHSQGFSKAPYKAPLIPGQKTQQDPNTKPLHEIVTLESGQKALRMWSFEKVGQNDKGQRSDPHFDVTVGDTLTFFVSALSFGRNDTEENSVLPMTLPNDAESIPAHSLLEISVSPKHNNRMRKVKEMLDGSEIVKEVKDDTSYLRINQVRLAEYSLHSYRDELFFFPTTMELARENSKKRIGDSFAISKDMEENETPFVVHRVSNLAFCNSEGCEETNLVKLIKWSRDDKDTGMWVDIPVHILQHYTNCADISHACSLLEIAAAMDALSIFVFPCNYWAKTQKQNSMFRAIPLIDTEKLLGFINKEDVSQQWVTDTEIRIHTGRSMMVEDEPWEMDLSIDFTVVNNSEGQLQSALKDFTLACGQKKFEKGYKFYFSLSRNNNEERIEGVYCGYYVPRTNSVSSAFSGDSKFVRKRPVSMLS